MPRKIPKRRRPAQEKLGGIKETILKDAQIREKSMIELANIYGVSPVSLLRYHKRNGIKKKRKKVYYPLGYKKGNRKSNVEELRNYIKVNNITKEEIILSMKL